MDDIEPISPPNSELDRLRTENAALKERCEKAEDALGCQADLEKDFADARTEVAALRAQLAEARTEIELAKRIDEARSQQPNWEKLWAEAIDRAEQAEAALAAAKGRITELERACKGKTECLVSAYEQRDKARARVAELEDHLERSGIYGNPGRYWEARWRDAEAERDALREALEYYACPGLSKCTRTKLKDGSCIMAISGECGDIANAALQTSPTAALSDPPP